MTRGYGRLRAAVCDLAMCEEANVKFECECFGLCAMCELTSFRLATLTKNCVDHVGQRSSLFP
jgi:hypothetical protein